MIAEAFGLDRRIANYQGVRPIGLYRWDIECLVDVIDSALKDPEYYSTHDSPEYQALKTCVTGCKLKKMLYKAATPS